MMKYVSKGAYLLGLLILLGISILFVNNIVEGVVSIDIPNESDIHRTRLHSLFLGNGDPYASIKLEENKIKISNGVIMGESSTIGDEASLVSIGGGNGNEIRDVSKSGIGGGKSNTINTSISVIGGGQENSTTTSYYGNENVVSAIAGGYSNETEDGGTIVGGEDNAANNGGVVIGGKNNTSNSNKSIILGENSQGYESSFAWNSVNTSDNSAVITASGGILIGTYIPILGVNLVVNGAIRIGSNDMASGSVGEIRMQSGCFYAYDGNRWHVINKNPSAECPNIRCEFETALLQEGETIQAYTQTYSENCSEKLVNINCNSDGILGDGGNYYSYCYNLSGYGFLSPSCGNANGQTYTTLPTSDLLCGVGTSSPVEESENLYTWGCSYRDNTVNCAAIKG